MMKKEIGGTAFRILCCRNTSSRRPNSIPNACQKPRTGEMLGAETGWPTTKLFSCRGLERFSVVSGRLNVVKCLKVPNQIVSCDKSRQLIGL
jgi:hypothetical protein